MCLSLIEIGSKTAEKNSAQTNKQTNRQTNRQTDTTKIMVTWPWTKNLLSSDMPSTCPYNMANFSPLAAEIDPVVWGIPANFNGFRVLAALLHGI